MLGRLPGQQESQQIAFLPGAHLVGLGGVRVAFGELAGVDLGGIGPVQVVPVGYHRPVKGAGGRGAVGGGIGGGLHVEPGRLSGPLETEEHAVGLQQFEPRHAVGLGIGQGLLGRQVIRQGLVEDPAAVQVFQGVLAAQGVLEFLAGFLQFPPLEIEVAQDLGGPGLHLGRLPLGGHVLQQRAGLLALVLGHQPLGPGQLDLALGTVNLRLLLQFVQQQVAHLVVADPHVDPRPQQTGPEGHLVAAGGVADLLQDGGRGVVFAQFPVALGQLQPDAVAVEIAGKPVQIFLVAIRRRAPLLQGVGVVAADLEGFGLVVAVGKLIGQQVQEVLAAVHRPDQQVVQGLQVEGFLEIRGGRKVLEKELELADGHAVGLEPVVGLALQEKGVVGEAVPGVLVEDLLGLAGGGLVIGFLLAGGLGRILVLLDGLVPLVLGAVEGPLGVVVGVVLGATGHQEQDAGQHGRNPAPPAARAAARGGVGRLADRQLSTPE